ncbi:MAG: 50S ribosomal protein L29 [Syntrophomonadaceae bacterium]|nr:50S ribosomal protein L29 [Syntrophomonadaceae bacterium]MDD3890267.1 50S ribosomal protein L29 [Syntrophomonadaceae bacterium]MDD4549303.1 50S ribosomal protein L29 [Syntrophomonadaceae bacterium]
MKVKKIRELTDEELNKKVADYKDELFNLRFQMATGQLDNPMRIRDVRKNIARCKTILRQREIERQRNA